MTQSLKGKRALVTGGSRGIGAAIAKRLAHDGCDVALTYVSQPEPANEVANAIKASGANALVIQADSEDPKAIHRAVEHTVTEFGGIDILVNNAGIGIMAPIEEFRLEDFDRTMAVNVRAPFIAAQAAAKYMRAGGRIIFIGSCNADRMPFMGGSVYATSKAALVGMVKGLSRDLGPREITVNNIQPGPVDTDLNPATGEFADSLRKLMALPRYGSGDEVASLVAYLAGTEAAFITGASLTIDGGFTS